MYELCAWAAKTEMLDMGLWRLDKAWKSGIFTRKKLIFGNINKMGTLVYVITSTFKPKKVSKIPSYQVIFASEFWVSKKSSNFCGTTRNSLWSMNSKNSNVPFKVLFLCLLRKSAGLCLFWSFFWGVLGSLSVLSAQFWSTPAMRCCCHARRV